MFGLDWSDPQTFWLNVMNAALGILCAACYLPVGAAIVREVWRAHRAGRGGRTPHRHASA